jgi:hypothetical protein
MLAFFAAAHSAQNVLAGVMLNHPFYWDADNLKIDTLGFEAALKTAAALDISKARTPRQACDSVLLKGKTFHRLKDPNAMSLAILADAGYPLLALTQWTGATETDVKVSSRGLDKDYMKRRLLTDMLWEVVDSAEVQKPAKTATDYTINLHFAEAGYSTWLAKDPIGPEGRQIMGTTAGIVLNYNQGGMSEDITVRRTIRSVYTIADASAKPQTITSAIEKGMDKLGLDLSYKVPELARVACGKDGK